MHLCLQKHSVKKHCHVTEKKTMTQSSNYENIPSVFKGGPRRLFSNKQGCMLFTLSILLMILTPGVIWAADDAPHIEKYKLVLPHIEKYKQVLAISGPMKLPSDVSVDQSGRIYILDGTADIVRVYSPNGEPLHTLGGIGILNQPLGIDVTPGGDVVVADSGNHRLALFNRSDSTPHFIELPSPVNGKPCDPTDVNFSTGNSFVVVDNDNHRVLSITASGKINWTTGVMGRNPAEFRFPFLLDIDQKGNIYVVEAINTRVQVLKPNGEYSHFIGDWGIEPGQFFRPKGVAVNDRNEVFVSDSYLGVIQVFHSDGGFIGVIGDGSGKITKFTTPVGMAAYGNRLYVVEMYSNRVLILEKQNQ